jgi:hypothetical protein
MASDKAGWGRVECGEDGSALGKKLKLIPRSTQSNAWQTFRRYYNTKGYVEAELYSPNMNFAEIMHSIGRRYFIKNLVKTWGRMEKTVGGTTSLHSKKK